QASPPAGCARRTCRPRLSGAPGGCLAMEPRRLRLLAGLRPHLGAATFGEDTEPPLWQGDSRDEYQRVAQDGVRRSEHDISALGNGTASILAVPLKRLLPRRRPPGAVPAHAVGVQKTVDVRHRTVFAGWCRG